MSSKRTRTLLDQTAREQIRTDLDHNVLVEAAAGTGKTTELVNRVVAVLAEGRATVDSIVAVTFTEKAAGELKLRMRQRLEQARQEASHEGETLARLESALARLEEARVGTIHGFCADLLRERSIEAEVDPQFETLREEEAERLYRDAFNVWLQEKLGAPPPGIRRSLRRLGRAPRWSGRPTPVNPLGPVDRLRRAGWMLAQWRNFPEPWTRPRYERELTIDTLVQQLHAFAQLTRCCDKPESDGLYQSTAAARQWDERIGTEEAVRERDYDGLEAAFVQLAGNRDFGARTGRGRFSSEVSRDEVLNACSALREQLAEFARQADADLAALLHGELFESVLRYEHRKQRNGKLDFVDLLLRTRDLVRDSIQIRREFQQRFSHLFIDEFQDTDPLQAEILLLLAADDPAVEDWRQSIPTPGKLFLVADPKQSIYRFRGADIGIYMEVRELLARCGALRLHLTTSFRSLPNIQNAVNAAFSVYMDGNAEALQADYVPLSPIRQNPKQPTLVALPVPRPYGKRGITLTAIDDSLPDAIGAFVDWLLRESGWTVSERESPDERVPVAARHVCLLFRRFENWGNDVTRTYVQALEARGIRHLLVGGRSFHEREEVETLRTALTAIEWPDDELSVFATLHGSLFGVGDEELLEYRQAYGRLHPFRPVEHLPPHLEDIARALELLATLHRQRNRRPIAETINTLLEKTRAHAGFVFRPSGDQVLANVVHVTEQARGYERGGGISFRGFVDRLLDEAETHRTAEAPILEEGSDGVRIMTVHRAKGLEFPMVVLADMTANITQAQAHRYTDPERRLCAQRLGGWSPLELLQHQEDELARDRAEGVRIAYVAATRARDLLVTPVIGDELFGGGAIAGVPLQEGSNLAKWLSPLNRCLYPPRQRWRQAEAAPLCPHFGDDSTVSRPFERAFDVDCVQPGLHRFDTGEASRNYEVVWWDPNALHLDAKPPFGIRQEALLDKNVDPLLERADLDAFAAWQSEHESTVQTAAQPKVRVQTATDRVLEHAQPNEEDVQVIEIRREGVPADTEAKRPTGRRFGTLVHAALASVRLDADRTEILQAVALQARILGASEDETRACLDTVTHVLRHEILQRARDAQSLGDVRRETPVTLRERDGTLVEGVVDLAFRDKDGWTVVDFKTDQEIGASLEPYRRQVRLYARAIESATGEPTTGVLLKI